MPVELVKQSNLKPTDDKTPFLEKIRNKESELSQLYTRMDTDRDRVYLNKYTLKDSKNLEIPNTISITMNDPAIYASAIAATLMTSKWQCQITSKNKRFNTHKIEQFLEDSDADGDERLNARGEPSLFEWLCNHVCVRSYIGCRFLYLYDENGELTTSYLPVDMRYTPFENSSNGLAWVAPKFWLNEDQIRAEFPNAVFSATGKDIEVIDGWDSFINELYIDGKLIYTQPHSIGYPPFVIQKPSTGFMLRDKGYLQYEAESIFALNRNLYDEWNRIVSIEQTMNMKLIMPSYQKETDDMAGTPADYPDGVGKVTEVMKDHKYELLETKDINAAHRMANNTISNGLQRGGVNNIDLGNVGMQVSAVWITEQAEIRSKILEPRLKCLANFRSRLAWMKINQYIRGQYAADMGKSGAKTSYNAAELGDPKSYSIGYTLKSKSKKMEIANLAMAQGARGVIPERNIITDIMEVDDPDGMIEQLAYEKAESSDPILFLFRLAYSIAVKAQDAVGLDQDRLNLESMRLTAKGIALAKSEQVQAQQGLLQPGGDQPTGKANSNTLIPMLGQPLGNGAGLSGISPEGGNQ
jgi:hypothetical protein